jgi:hypothetical protein
MLRYVAYVRCYERPAAAGARIPAGDFPPNVARWIDDRYKAQYIQVSDQARDPVRFYLLPPVEVTIDMPGQLHRLKLNRAVVDSPHIDVCEAILWSDRSDQPDELHDQVWGMIVGKVQVQQEGVDEQRRLSALWDAAIDEVFGADPTQWRKTAFGGLGVFVGAEAPVELARRYVNQWSSDVMLGITDRHHVVVERNRCTVIVPDDEELAEVSGGYLLLTALMGRSRHVSWTLHADVAQLAESTVVADVATRASGVLAEAAELQRRGVIARREMRAMDYLGDPGLISLFNLAAPVAAISEHDRRGLDDALEGLDRMVNGVFAVEADRAQRRLNQVGFGIALISVLLAAPGITDLIQASESDRSWVYLTGLLSIVAFALIVSLSRASWAAQIARRVARRPNRRRNLGQ